jgi:ADP-ribose pyrophosphatase
VSHDFEYGFPAGLIDENETVLSAIERELKEETGYTVKYLREVSPFVYNSAGLTNESISIAFVTVEEKYKEQKLELTEEIEVLELNKNQILDLLKDSNNKFGAKAWLILNSFVNGFLPF